VIDSAPVDDVAGTDSARFSTDTPPVDTAAPQPDAQTDTADPEPVVGNHAQFVSQSVPAQVEAGASFTAEVTMRNTGTTTWSKADGYYLGSEGPQDNFTWDTNRMVMDAELVIQPQGTVTFSRVLKAPAEPGSHTFQWRMLQDAVEWFGDPSEQLTIEVTQPQWAQYESNPFVFDLEQPQVEGEVRGSVFVHQLSGDDLYDFVITGPGVVAVYDHFGALMWKKTDDIHLPGSANGGSGYPGTHAPGAIAGDMDGDSAPEVAYLTFDGELIIRDGATGDKELTHSFPGAEAIAIADLRGLGDRDAVLQYSQTEVRAIDLTTGETLWHKTDWFGIEHSQVRVADIDGDGRDEVVGPVFLDDDGKRMNGWDLKKDRGTALGGLDSLTIGDIVPGGPLEIALAEQGGNNETLVVNHEQIYWGKKRPPGDIPPSGQCKNEKDPDKVAAGDFDAASPGLEIFARSACGNHPWVHSSTGDIIASWDVPTTAPEGWLHYEGEGEYGIEVIRPVSWSGGDTQQVSLKERHVEGKVAVVDAMTGAFAPVYDVKSTRSYAADISGDSREEIIILTAGEPNGRLEVHWNAAAYPDPKPRPWVAQHYRRTRQNWNYYSP